MHLPPLPWPVSTLSKIMPPSTQVFDQGETTMKRKNPISTIAMKAVTAALLSAAGMGQQSSQNPQPTQPSAQPCADAPEPPKKMNWLEREKARLKQRLEHIAEQKENEAAGKIVKGTKGNLDGSVLPSIQDFPEAGPKQPKPCIATPPPPAAAPAAPATTQK